MLDRSFRPSSSPPPKRRRYPDGPGPANHGYSRRAASHVGGPFRPKLLTHGARPHVADLGVSHLM